MTTNANAVNFPSVNASLEQLSDAALLSTTRSLIGRSNQLLAALLAHLGEVEARGIHRTRACSSLYTYCIYELRLSEDEAYRRVAAARLVRRFSALFEAVASGELHLTGLLMLGPHLTEENVSEVLGRAKHRTKKEIARLVRSLAPMPDVPARIEPLGPAPARLIPPSGSWNAFMQSLCPVRGLAPGDRPRDWIGSENGIDGIRGVERLDGFDGAGAGDRVDGAGGVDARGRVDALDRVDGAGGDDSRESVAAASDAVPAPARVKSAEPIGPQRYSVQFTATEEYVGFVERAKALLSRALPNAAPEEIQLRAMRACVAELEKKRFAVTARPRARAGGVNRGGIERVERVKPIERVERAEPVECVDALSATTVNPVNPSSTSRPSSVSNPSSPSSPSSEPTENAPEGKPKAAGRRNPRQRGARGRYARKT